jgi:acyl transferase domain-containing protein/phosphopantetheinyl transferase
MPDASRGVAIVGIGALFPGAGDTETFWSNIVRGVDAITEVPADRWDADIFYDPEAEAHDRVYCKRGGFIDGPLLFEPTDFGIMPVTVESAEPDQLIALRVAADAIADTLGGLPDGDRVGVVVGRGGYYTPGMARFDQRVRVAEQLAQTLADLAPELPAERVQEVKAAFQARLGPVRPEGAIDLVPNLAASRIANRLDLRGPAYTLDAACASSLLAVEQACHDLRSGRADAVIAGGVHHCHDVAFWTVFSQLRALSTHQQIRPFDREADGLLIGEGTGMVVLKRVEDAERAGDRIYAVVAGTGSSSDGKGSSVMVPRVEGQLLALQRAWQDAGLDPATVGLVEAHGTATPVGDEAELTTLGRFFGPEGAQPRAGVGSVKSMIGHAMPAAGMAGLIKTALALHHRVLPPTLHCEDPHPGFVATRFRPITEVEPWLDELAPAGQRRAGVNAFGFGGINAHLVLTEAPGAPAPAPNTVLADTSVAPAGLSRPERAVGDRVVLLAGSQPADLLAGLDDPSILTTRDDLVSPPPEGALRLALVDPTEKRVALARKVVERGTPWRGRNEVWFSADGLLAGGGRTAFVFPGVEPSFAPNAHDVAEHFGLQSLEGQVDDLGHQGAGIIALGRMLHSALTALGIDADLVAGHSIGEWNAMIASGLVAADTIDEFIAEIDLDAIEVPDLVFAALGCGVEVASEATAGITDLVVSHDNCPHQSVICGHEADVEAALVRLRERRVMGQVLPFRSGFHTPLLAPYLAPAHHGVDRVVLTQPQIPVWSATTVDPYPDDHDAVRALVIQHLLEPVRFRELALRLHDEGVRAFVQVGVGSLPGFLDDTLKERDALTVSAGSEDRAGLDQLARVAAALWVEGAEPRFSILRDGSGGAPEAGTARPARTGVALHMGAPLVHLEGQHLSVGDAAPAADLDPAHPVTAELGAALREAAAAGRAVATAWGSGPSARAVPRPAVPAAPPADAAPEVPAAEVSTTRILSLDNMPWLVDHAFNRQREGWPDVSDRFPLVPMTGTLELMREAAAAQAPGRLPVAIEDVRAMRWLAVEPPAEITITTRPLDADRVRVTIEGYSRGTVVLADTWPEPPPPDTEPLGEVAPEGPTGRDLYDQHWLFHGPEFQGIRDIGPMGPGGMTAQIECLPAPGAILDAAGQLVGHWLAVRADKDQLALPRHLDAVRWYAPTPAPGTRLDVTMWLRTVDDETVCGDLELVDLDGRLWCRIDAWEDHRFQTDDITWPLAREPELRGAGEIQPGGWVLVRERWGNTASRELTMRRYLARVEREQYEDMNPNAQRQWLLGRIAAKDAVRYALWDGGAGPIFPAEVVVTNNEAGQPSATSATVAPELLDGVCVSVAHTAWLSVAIVADEPVGIDVERVEPRPERFDSLVMADSEVALLPPGRDEDEWRARVWTAKESAAKAAGTGFEGNPKRFVVSAVDGERLQVDGRWVATTVFIDRDQTYVAAWTETGDVA